MSLEKKCICLKPGRERSLLRHHPWVFSGAIDGEFPTCAPGDLVSIVSATGEVLGSGWYSPASQIRVRMLTFGGEDPSGPDFLAGRVAAAVGRRAGYFADAYTNAVRLVNAESDGLPGVVADYYDGWVVCQFTSAGADACREELAAALRDFAPGCRGVSERCDLKDRVKEGLPTEPSFRVLAGEEPPAEIEITEGACKFLVDVRNGHKTGFYLDQREARRLVGSLANGREVLNCFSYTGGFGLFARAAGATKVTQVDISEDALKQARKNERLVHFCGTEMDYVAADVFKFLRECRDAGRRFDLVILDPPKFAGSRAAVEKAARGYKDINLLAMKVLRPDGILATFSCSGAMEEPFFEKVVSEAALDAQCRFQILDRTHAASDHPVALSFPEGAYLKGLVLRRI